MFGEVGILDTSKLLLSPYCFELRMSLVQQYWPGFSNFTTISDIMWCYIIIDVIITTIKKDIMYIFTTYI